MEKIPVASHWIVTGAISTPKSMYSNSGDVDAVPVDKYRTAILDVGAPPAHVTSAASNTKPCDGASNVIALLANVAPPATYGATTATSFEQSLK